MKRILLLPLIFVFSCKNTKVIDSHSPDKLVTVYTLPFNKTYFISVDYKKVATYKDAKIKRFENAKSHSELVSFLKYIDTCKISEVNSNIDARVLVELKSKGELIQFGMDKDFSLIIYNNKVYYQTSYVKSIIMKNTDILGE